MTPEEKRTAIAEAMGAPSGFSCEIHGAVPESRLDEDYRCPWCGSACTSDTPNYLKSRDAIHIALATLTHHEWGIFHMHLTNELAKALPENRWIFTSDRILAEPHLLAEAFGLTRRLWRAEE